MGTGYCTVLDLIAANGELFLFYYPSRSSKKVEGKRDCYPAEVGD